MEFIGLVESGNDSAVLACIKQHDMNFVDENGRSALECAIECGHTDITKALLEAGANPNLTNNVTGNSPLMCAAEHQRYQEMKLLQYHGAVVNSTHGKDGLSALHIICRKGDTDGFRTLIIKGADVALPDKNGRTPLHYACNAYAEATENLRNQIIELVGLLLQWGALPGAFDKSGIVALDVKSELYKLATVAVNSEVVKDGDGAYFEVECPSIPALTGLYEMVNDEHFQRRGSSHILIKNSMDNLWSFSDSFQFLLVAGERVDSPLEVLSWNSRTQKLPHTVLIRQPEVIRAACDECRAYPILGPAFFCVSRHDYDLCSRCEMKNLQPFPMVKYYQNSQRPRQFIYKSYFAENLDTIPSYDIDVSEVEHTDVTCCLCQVSPILGARFKCAVRPDFDICSACEASTSMNRIPPNAMVKIYDPRHRPVVIEYTSRFSLSAVVHKLGSHPGSSELTEEDKSVDYDPSFLEEHAFDPVAPQNENESNVAGFGTVERFEVICSSLPTIEGLYEYQHEAQYVSIQNANNMLVMHPVDGVWCVTNGECFVMMAVEPAAHPAAVKKWKCLLPGNRRMVQCEAVSIRRK